MAGTLREVPLHPALWAVKDSRLCALTTVVMKMNVIYAIEWITDSRFPRITDLSTGRYIIYGTKGTIQEQFADERLRANLHPQNLLLVSSSGLITRAGKKLADELLAVVIESAGESAIMCISVSYEAVYKVTTEGVDGLMRAVRRKQYEMLGRRVDDAHHISQ